MSGGAIEVGSSSESSKPECYISRSKVVYTIRTTTTMQYYYRGRQRNVVFKAAEEIPSSSSAAFGIASGGFSTTLCRLEIRTAILLYNIYYYLQLVYRDLIDRSLTFEYIYLLVNCCVSHPYPEQRPLVYFFPCLIIRSGKKFGGN